MRLLVLGLFILAAACPTPVCNPTESRCNGATAEICGSDGVWRVLMDCAAESMTCCFLPADPIGIPEGYSCLPTCPAVPDGGDASNEEGE